MEWNARKNHKKLFLDGKKIYFEVTCPRCNHKTLAEMDKIGYKFWIKAKMKVQYIFPDATKEGRELLISGLCMKCQKEVFENV